MDRLTPSFSTRERLRPRTSAHPAHIRATSGTILDRAPRVSTQEMKTVSFLPTPATSVCRWAVVGCDNLRRAASSQSGGICSEQRPGVPPVVLLCCDPEVSASRLLR